ncbi:hypothetical protein M5K25_016251 [Dendrobium thyrsiflorum]|uniref:Uncharacterized protein n=1 Tax=Dendrobium thyrsiflorum TaxID=117978 RepID=A0ABD0UJS4_DENTH
MNRCHSSLKPSSGTIGASFSFLDCRYGDPNHGFAAVDVLVNCEAKLGFLFDPASLPLSTIRFVALLFVLLPLSR